MGAISTLKINISANSAKFNSELDKARKNSKSFADSSKKQLKVVGGAFAAGSAVAVAALTQMVSSTMTATREISNLKRVAGASTPSFMRMAYGAKQFGIEQDKLSDILKDTNDRIGDYIQTGGGPMADFFENIAPKVGVTAEQFARLSGPEALQLFYTSLERANLSQKDMTFYMEAVASDLTLLQPMLANNGEEWSKAAAFADKYGLVLSDLDLEKINNATENVRRVKDMSQGYANVLTVAVAPGIEAMTRLWIDNGSKAQDWARVTTTGTDFVIKGIGFAADAVRGLAVVFSGVRWVGGEVMRALVDSINFFYSRMISSYNAVARVIPGMSEITQNKLTEISESMYYTNKGFLDKFKADLERPMPSGAIIATYNEIKDGYLSAQQALDEASTRATEVDNVNTELTIANVNRQKVAYMEYYRARVQQEQNLGTNIAAYQQYYAMRQKAHDADQKKWLLNSEQRYHLQRKAIAANGTASFLNDLMGAFNSFAQAGEANSKKDFEKQKKWAKATAVVNAGAAIVRSFAEMPFWAALGASTVIGIKTAAQIRQIDKQEFSGGGDASASSSPGGGGFASGGFTSNAPAEYAAPAAQQSNKTEIHLNGNFTGLDEELLAEALMNQMSERINEGDYVFIDGGSRAASEIRSGAA